MISEQKTSRTLQGQIVSNKMDKSVVVMIVMKKKHPVYGKYVKHTKRLIAHDENNQCQEGDTVLIQECRPLSKNKTWMVKEIITKNA